MARERQKWLTGGVGSGATSLAVWALAPMIPAVSDQARILIGSGALLIAFICFVMAFRAHSQPTKSTAPSYLHKSRYADQSQASDEELTYWLHADEMPLWKAAYLWTGKIPALEYPKDAPGVVRALAERMAKDAQRGNLRTVNISSENTDPIWGLLSNAASQSEYATVSREGLLAYAKLRNERPRFLYPS